MVHFPWASDSFLKSPYFSVLKQPHSFNIDSRELQFYYTACNITTGPVASEFGKKTAMGQAKQDPDLPR